MKNTIACIVGTRPNFVKIGPVLKGLAIADPNLQVRLVHTGQHYTRLMSDDFFQQLELPAPDIHLQVGSGSHAEQTARILTGYESWLLANPQRATLVVGDVNSTLACALVSAKLNIPVIHVEAGLRSFDKTMPEEINRIVTDSISDLLLVSESQGVDNLLNESHHESKIKLVGNVMIDTLLKCLPAAKEVNQPKMFGLESSEFIVWTMHRPSNVDDLNVLSNLVSSMQRISRQRVVVFPVHPRTRRKLEEFGLMSVLRNTPGIFVIPPLGYLEFLSLTSSAKMVITDSGGLQEETTVLGIPCLTLRKNTERPITVLQGTSVLVGSDTNLLEEYVNMILAGRYKRGFIPQLWDGKAGERISKEVVKFLVRAPS